MSSPSSLRAIGPAEWAALLTLSVIWGGSYLFMKIAVVELPVFVIVFSRVALGAMTLGVILLLMRQSLPGKLEHWLAFFGMGLLNNAVPMSLIVFGTQSISAGLASIINALTPLFTILIASKLTSDEALTPNKVIGVIIGFVGVIILIGPGLVFEHDISVIGELACVGAALSYACSNVFGRRFARLGLKPLAIAFGQTTSASVILLPFALIMNAPWTLPTPSFTVALSVVALGMLCTGVAYLLFFRVLTKSGATAIALVTLMIPPSAIALGAVVLGEKLILQHALGLVVIAIGLIVVNRKRS